MSEYRYQLDRYRGRSTRYICPQCKRKQSFTRYIDTYNNNEYVSDNVGKCNRIDKCGYHYTPKQYYTDNPWKRENSSSGGWLVGQNVRGFDQPTKTKPSPRSGGSGGWSVEMLGFSTNRPRPSRLNLLLYLPSPTFPSGWTPGHKHRESVRVSRVQLSAGLHDERGAYAEGFQNRKNIIIFARNNVGIFSHKNNIN